MKKPEGTAEPGWYDEPETPGMEQYWNGKYWSKHKRELGEIGPEVFPHDQKFLHKSLFRLPLEKDYVFAAYIIISALSIFSSIKQDIDSNTRLPLFITFFGSLFLFAWVYLLFLIILIPRRVMDKKKGMTHKSYIASGEASRKKIKGFKELDTNSKIIILACGIFIVIGFVYYSSTKSSLASESNRYYETEQKISAVVKDWNVAATPISMASIKITNGTMGVDEARLIALEFNSASIQIHQRLKKECDTIPSFNRDAEGEQGAVGKAYFALQVTCEGIPKESSEVLALIREQISPNWTQARLDYHNNQLAEIINNRKSALLESLDALEPYASSSQKEEANRLRKLLQ
ncbi:MAG: DUF2510 domain-containing protein [Methylophilaceae bacterium]|nr:MAG: DUF2510 domain-containing protein [Methylophilaceae bacterium]